MEFNPRTATGIPTEPVGSIPRPLKLQQAYAAYDAKKITKAQLEEEQNAAVADTIKRFEATGSPIITDGEQRVSSFATYPVADTLAGTGLAPNLAPGGQYFAIFADGHNRQLPKITGGSLNSRKLKSPKGPNVRPTPGRVKESLFSILMHRIDGASVLDLFSGTGAIAFEAASRGVPLRIVDASMKQRAIGEWLAAQKADGDRHGRIGARQ